MVKRKLVFLNEKTDKDIMDYIEDKKFSTYVKELIRRDIRGDKILNGGFMFLSPQQTQIPPVPVEEDKPKPNMAGLKNMLKK